MCDCTYVCDDLHSVFYWLSEKRYGQCGMTPTGVVIRFPQFMILNEFWTSSKTSIAWQESMINEVLSGAETYRGTGGTAPKIWGGGTAHAFVSPIFWEVMFVRRARKHEQSKKGIIKELFSEIGVFLVKKGSYTTLHTVQIQKKDRKNLEKTVDD